MKRPRQKMVPEWLRRIRMREAHARAVAEIERSAREYFERARRTLLGFEEPPQEPAAPQLH